jgi:hypothetical protein
VPDGEVDLRVAYLTPLLTYVRALPMQPGRLLSMACLRAKAAGLPLTISGRVWPDKLARGRCVIPPWLVEQCCAVLGAPVSVVMGAEWVKRFGADGRGGSERAPVGFPHLKHAYRASARWFAEQVEHQGEQQDIHFTDDAA